MIVFFGGRGARLTVGVAVVAAVATGIGGAKAVPAAVAASSTWYVSSSGSDAAPCTRAATCATLTRAFKVARAGDVVEIAGGSYPVQTIAADPAKEGATARVVFRPAPDSTVSLAGIAAGNNRTGVGPKHFELHDLKVAGGVRIVRGTEDVVLRNIDAGVFNITSARNVRMYGGDFGPWLDGVAHINACGYAGCVPAEDILIDGALFHDFTISNPAKHSECLMIWPGRRVTIRNSTFRNCTDFDILVKPYKTGLVGSPGDITLENNIFDDPMPGATATVSCNPGCARSGNAIAITDGSGEAWSGVQIRYNSSLGGIRIDPAVTNVTVKGNVARKDANSGCLRTVTFGYNVWSGAQCSSSDRAAGFSNLFAGPSSASFDLRLPAGSRAIGAGDQDDHPVRDIGGRLRPVALPPDAGAWQREPALVVAGRAIGTAKIGMGREDVVTFYGRPRKRAKDELPDGSRVDVEHYRVRGGMLRVTYRNEKAIAIATTSPYYRTLKSLTVGTPMRARQDDDWTCRPVGGSKGKARLYLRPTRSKKPKVAELTIVAARVVPLCATAPKR